MEVLYEQRISLGKETNTLPPLISVSPPVDTSHDHLEENSREESFLSFRNLEDLLGHLARQGYVAEKAVDLVHAKDALSVMDMIQLHLDEEKSHDNLFLRKTCIRCLLHLNKRHGTLPTSIHLSKVTKDGHHPVSGGGYADIYKGRLEDTQPVCLKVLRVYTATYDEKRLSRQLSNEVLIWRQLKHPNILQFLGITKELFQPSYCIVSPWMENGNVISYSRAHETTLNAKVKMMYEISEGLRYLHEHQPPIVHSDIKGLNILVSDEGICHLADFGLATVENDTPEGQIHLSTSQALVRGSVPWLAPELMNPDHVGVPCRTTRDIYALGCTIYELLAGKAPFSEKKMDFQIIMEVLNGSRPLRPDGCPDLVWSIVESCWKEEFQLRPSAAQVAGQLAEMHGEAVRLYEGTRASTSPRKEMASERVWEEPLPSSPSGRRRRSSEGVFSKIEKETERGRERESDDDRIHVVDSLPRPRLPPRPPPRPQHPHLAPPTRVSPSAPPLKGILKRPFPTSEDGASMSTHKVFSATDCELRPSQPSLLSRFARRSTTSASKNEVEIVQPRHDQTAGHSPPTDEDRPGKRRRFDDVTPVEPYGQEQQLPPPPSDWLTHFFQEQQLPSDWSIDLVQNSWFPPRSSNGSMSSGVDSPRFPPSSPDNDMDSLRELPESWNVSPPRDHGVQQGPDHDHPSLRPLTPRSDADEGLPRSPEIVTSAPLSGLDLPVSTHEWTVLGSDNVISLRRTPPDVCTPIGTAQSHYRRASGSTRSEPGEAGSPQSSGIDSPVFTTSPRPLYLYSESWTGPPLFPLEAPPPSGSASAPIANVDHATQRPIDWVATHSSSDSSPPNDLRSPLIKDLEFLYSPQRQGRTLESAVTVGGTSSAPSVATSMRTARASRNRRKQEALFHCPVPGCGSTFTRSFNLKGHLRLKHNRDEVPESFTCHRPGCGLEFARQDEYDRHEQLDHAEYPCSVCQRPFASMSALIWHLDFEEDGVECQRALQENKVSERLASKGYEVHAPILPSRSSSYSLLNDDRFDEKTRDNQEAKPGACARCKDLKLRCEYMVDTGPCKRCLNGGHECVTPGRKKRGSSSKLDQEDHDPYLSSSNNWSDEESGLSGSEQSNNQKAKPGACARCRNLKIRCEYMSDARPPCKRCSNGGHECVRPGRKKIRWSSNRKRVEEGEDNTSGDGHESAVLVDVAAPFGLMAKLPLGRQGVNSELGTDVEDVGVANPYFFGETWDYESLRDAWNRFRTRVGIRSIVQLLVFSILACTRVLSF